MSKFITATNLDILSKVVQIVKCSGFYFSGVYPTSDSTVYIVSTGGEAGYQTVNAITRQMVATTQADFRDFVEGKR